MKSTVPLSIILLLSLACIFFSCDNKVVKKIEQLANSEFRQSDKESSDNTIDSTKALTTTTNSVLLTGIDQVRLIPLYKVNSKSDKNIHVYENSSYSPYNEPDGDYKYFMPGMDFVYGYNMVNVAHYDVANDKLSYFFEKPVIVRTLYFPGVKSDSLYNKPVTRDYFLTSVYDEDTNGDTLINTNDLRRFYHIDRNNTKKTLLIPADYSVIRSSYDPINDLMFIHARQDANQNGTPEKFEPVAIFTLRLKEPTVVKKIL